MPNSKKQKEPGLEDELRKMILENVRVQDDQPRAPAQPSNKGYRHQNARMSSPASKDQLRQARDGHGSFNTNADSTRRNGSAPHEPRNSDQRDANDHRHGSRSTTWRSMGANAQPGNTADREAYARPPPRSRQLFQPNARPSPRPPPPAIFIAQCEYLDRIASTEIAQSQMSYEEYSAKEAYRDTLERGFRQTLQQIGLPGDSILGLRGFGSFSSGFATANSDVDLAVVLRPMPTQTVEQFAILNKEMPRLLEKALLDAGFGARLLDRTRVPIIKTCQAPTPELLVALRDERLKWDQLPEDEKYATKPRKENDDVQEVAEAASDNTEWRWKEAGSGAAVDSTTEPQSAKLVQRVGPGAIAVDDSAATAPDATAPAQNGQDGSKSAQRSKGKPWLREKPRGPLDFPKDGVGIQADINFSNALALHNTELLRCYSLCDPRVQPMVLFVKAWAKRRKINSSYNGTLSSYGYVLMVLHFLINVAQPPVLPNLQLMQGALGQDGSLQWQAPLDEGIVCDGYKVKFWRDADTIKQFASRGLLNQSQEPLGVLLRNFFHHYAHQGNVVIGGGFQWTSEVLSLRTRGGLLTKEEKGWTGAKTTTTDNREVRHRYLFAIEDPFELDHNVARTVTHHGIVAIRDEFRRAWRILMDVGNGRQPQQGHLFDPIVDTQPLIEPEQTLQPRADVATV